MTCLLLAVALLAGGAEQVPADITADSIEAYTRATNQNKLMMILPLLGAEAGAVVSVPVAWFAGWMATGFNTDVDVSVCGLPSCNFGINYPVFWSGFALSTACIGISSGKLAGRWGKTLDLNQARAEYLAALARRSDRPGRLSFSHIWYFGAGGAEYGYNMGRFTVGRMSYIYAPAYVGIGIEGPSYFPEQRKWRPPMLEFYLMPYRASYRIGQIDFLRSAYVFLAVRPRAADSTSRTTSFNAGVGFSFGSLVTIKIGAAQNLSDTLRVEIDPDFYASVEVEWGSWFFARKFQPAGPSPRRPY